MSNIAVLEDGKRIPRKNLRVSYKMPLVCDLIQAIRVEFNYNLKSNRLID